MKTKLSLFVIVAVLCMFVVAPSAQAKDWGNGEKNVGWALTRPLVAVGHVVEALGNLVQAKPGKLLSLPDTARKDAFDVVEGPLRTLINADALPASDRGSVTSAISDAGLDPVVDFTLYALLGGILTHNLVDLPAGNMLDTYAIGAGSGTLAVGLDVAGEALDGK